MNFEIFNPSGEAVFEKVFGEYGCFCHHIALFPKGLSVRAPKNAVPWEPGLQLSSFSTNLGAQSSGESEDCFLGGYPWVFDLDGVLIGEFEEYSIYPAYRFEHILFKTENPDITFIGKNSIYRADGVTLAEPMYVKTKTSQHFPMNKAAESHRLFTGDAFGIIGEKRLRSIYVAKNRDIMVKTEGVSYDEAKCFNAAMVSPDVFLPVLSHVSQFVFDGCKVMGELKGLDPISKEANNIYVNKNWDIVLSEFKITDPVLAGKHCSLFGILPKGAVVTIENYTNANRFLFFNVHSSDLDCLSVSSKKVTLAFVAGQIFYIAAANDIKDNFEMPVFFSDPRNSANNSALIFSDSQRELFVSVVEAKENKKIDFSGLTVYFLVRKTEGGFSDCGTCFLLKDVENAPLKPNKKAYKQKAKELRQKYPWVDSSIVEKYTEEQIAQEDEFRKKQKEWISLSNATSLLYSAIAECEVDGFVLKSICTGATIVKQTTYQEIKSIAPDVIEKYVARLADKDSFARDALLDPDTPALLVKNMLLQ